MAAVDADAVEAAGADEAGAHDKVFGDARHVRLRHGADVHAVRTVLLVRADGLLRPVERDLLRAGVAQLAQRDRAVGVDAPGVLADALRGVALRLPEIDRRQRDADRVAEVHVELSDADHGVAAAGARLQLSERLFARLRVQRDQREGHRGVDDAVFQRVALVELQGGEQMRETCRFHE